MEDACVGLVNNNLLQGDVLNYMHQLIREFSKHKLSHSYQEDHFKQTFAMTMAEEACKIPETITSDFVQVFLSLIPHVTEAVNYFTVYLNGDDVVRLFVSLGRFYPYNDTYILNIIISIT